MTILERRTTRRELLLEALALTGSIIACNRSGLLSTDQNDTTSPKALPSETPPASSEAICTIEPGQAVQLSHLEYINRFTGYDISIHQPALEALSEEFNFSLRDPSTLRVVLTSEYKFPNPQEETYGYVYTLKDEPPSKLLIAGQRFVEEVILQTGNPPQTMQDYAFLSIAHSIALVFGHLELDVLDNRISREQALSTIRKYSDAILDFSSPRLPSWMSTAGNAPPKDFQLHAALLSNHHVAFIQSLPKRLENCL